VKLTADSIGVAPPSCRIPGLARTARVSNRAICRVVAVLARVEGPRLTLARAVCVLAILAQGEGVSVSGPLPVSGLPSIVVR